jgi:plasmid stabilization system protein ParE
MADFRLTPAALRDLEGIWRYTVQQRGVAQAERYLDALNASFEALALAPFSARHATTSGRVTDDTGCSATPCTTGLKRTR